MSSGSNLVDLLPHRPPMLLLDEAQMGDDGILTARHTVPEDDPVLRGHFPGFPIWPGALLLEAMAQTTAICLMHKRGALRPEELPVLGAVDVRFLQPVFPGEALHFRTELVREISDKGLFSVTARRDDGSVVARGRISAGIHQRPALATAEAG